MRFDKRCTLISKGQKHYDVDLGKMVGDSEVTKTVPCNIGPVSAQLQNLLGDKLKEATAVVRVRNCKDKVDSLLIDGQPFSIVDNPKHANRLTVFYVSEVNHGSS